MTTTTANADQWAAEQLADAAALARMAVCVWDLAEMSEHGSDETRLLTIAQATTKLIIDSASLLTDDLPAQLAASLLIALEQFADDPGYPTIEDVVRTANEASPQEE